MSAEIVSFPTRKESHLAGEAYCVGCQHKWGAVAPVGTRWLECPSCGSKRGAWRYAVGAQAGDLVLTCDCGSEALTAYKHDGKFWLRCMGCGADQTETVFG